MKRSFVNLENTAYRPDRTYGDVIRKIKADGICPFCPAHIRRYHKKPIIKTGRHWVLTENMYPYKGAKHHLLFVHKKHIERFSEISPAAWKELSALITFVAAKRKIKGGALLMRFGKTAYTGASVAHLHANVISPDIRKKNRKPIIARVGQTEKILSANLHAQNLPTSTTYP